MAEPEVAGAHFVRLGGQAGVRTLVDRFYGQTGWATGAVESMGAICRPCRFTLLRRAAVLCTVAVSAACVVLPQTRDVYDAECRMVTRQVTLGAAYIGGFHACAGDGCLMMLTAAGVVTAASAVISGSIALVGNVAYWIERQGRCNRTDVLQPTSAPTSAPASKVSGTP